MSSTQTTVDYILEQIGDAGQIVAKKMFGEFGIYCDGKLVALICDDQLFVKPTREVEKFIDSATMGTPYPGAKPCFLISGDKWDNRDWMTKLFQLTSTNLPEAKKKRGRKKQVN